LVTDNCFNYSPDDIFDEEEMLMESDNPTGKAMQS
jgi:hypothetical protein